MVYSFILIIAFIVILFDTDKVNINYYVVLTLLLFQFSMWYLLYINTITDIVLWLIVLYLTDVVICLSIINIKQVRFILKAYCYFCIPFLIYLAVSTLNVSLYVPKLDTVLADRYIDFILLSLHVDHGITRIMIMLILLVGFLL